MTKINTGKKDTMTGDKAIANTLNEILKEMRSQKKAESKANIAKAAADKKAKDLAKDVSDYKKAIQKLEEQRKEERYQSRLRLAKNSVDAVMPSERRADFGAAAVGTIAGIDPAFVKMLGIDKLGANLWNSVFGWSAINKRHQNKLREEKINEQFGINTGKDKEKYGSVVKDNPTKELKEINKNTRETAKNTSSDKGISVSTKDEKGGLLSKLMGFLGFAGKLIGPILAGILLTGLKPLIKDLITKGLSSILGEDMAGLIGGGLTDILQGAIPGFLIAKSFGLNPLKGALIGGAISFVLPRLKALVSDVIGLFTGKDATAKPADSILAGVITGASIGAFTGKGMSFSLRGMLTGAVIGGASALILSVVTQGKEMLQGALSGEKPTDTILSMLMAGATIGAFAQGTKLSLKGLIVGSIIGGAAGVLTSMVTDTIRMANGFSKGEDPSSAFGKYGKLITTTIAGAAIGAKYGIKGAIIGGLIGGAIGGIMTLIDSVNSDVAGARKVGQESLKSFTTQGPSSEATTTSNYAVNKKRELEAKKKAGTITKDEQKELDKLEGGLLRTEKRLNDFNNADTNRDGIVTAEELSAWEKSDKGSTWGLGGTAKSQTQMKELLKRSGGKGFSAQDLADYQLEKYGVSLESAPMQTATQITENSEEQLDQTKKTNEYLEKIAKAYDDPENLPRTNVVNNNSAPQQTNINAYSTEITGAGLEH